MCNPYSLSQFYIEQPSRAMQFLLLFLFFSLILSSDIIPNYEDNEVSCNGEHSSLSTESESMCNYRSKYIFPASLWNLKAGAECYNYSSIYWLINNTKKKFSKSYKVVNGKTYTIEYIKIYNYDNNSAMDVYFDYKNTSMTKFIRKFYKEEMHFKKWERCSIEAEECCQNSMTVENIYPTKEYPCPALWDGWSCIAPAKNGTVVQVLCPSSSKLTAYPCHMYGSKECFPNGTWNDQTNYETCTSSVVYGRRYNFSVDVGYVSTALSFPAVVILSSFKPLRILRVSLHRNLITACILRNVFNILSKKLVLLDALKSAKSSKGVMAANGVGCRTLAFLSSVSLNAIYACMLADGFYLHKLIVRVFAKEPREYVVYCVVAVLSIVPSAIWAAVVATEADKHCWMADSSGYQWITDGFRIVMLAVNLLFMLDIFRVLLKKATSQKSKSTAKAMFFLMPLFGVPFILTANRNIVDRTSCLAGDIYNGVSQIIYGLQGVIVAILFCYLNEEVHAQFKKLYRNIKERLGMQVTVSNNVTRMTSQPSETSPTSISKEDKVQLSAQS